MFVWTVLQCNRSWMCSTLRVYYQQILCLLPVKKEKKNWNGCPIETGRLWDTTNVTYCSKRRRLSAPLPTYAVVPCNLRYLYRMKHSCWLNRKAMMTTLVKRRIFRCGIYQFIISKLDLGTYDCVMSGDCWTSFYFSGWKIGYSISLFSCFPRTDAASVSVSCFQISQFQYVVGFVVPELVQ